MYVTLANYHIFWSTAQCYSQFSMRHVCSVSLSLCQYEKETPLLILELLPPLEARRHFYASETQIQ